MGTFLKYFASILPLIAPVTQAIESLVTEGKSGATKKQLAMDSLGVATAVAQTIDPNDTVSINAAKTLASTTIDSIVAVQNALKGATPAPGNPQVATS